MGSDLALTQAYFFTSFFFILWDVCIFFPRESVKDKYLFPESSNKGSLEECVDVSVESCLGKC